MGFDSCKTAIFASSYALNVEHTTMTRVDIGIDVANGPRRDIILDGNTISARKYGIRSSLNEPLHYSSVIRNNTVTITGLAAGANPVSGIRMDEWGLGFTPKPGQTVPQPFGTDGWEVSGNTVTLQKGGLGILYRNGFYGQLESNTVNDQGQTSSPGEYDGIRVDGSTFSQINYNDVTRSTSAGGNAASRAIHSKAGFANGFTCNCLDNTGVGMQFFDMADYTNNVRGNKFHDHDGTGLQLGDDNIGNAYIGIQYHSGNEWYLASIPSGGYGGVNWGSASDITFLSRFFIDPDEKNGALNPPVDPQDWFKAEPTSSSFDCENNCSAPSTRPPFTGETDVPTALDEAIATDSLPTDGWEHEAKWKGAYRLYRKMLRQPAIENYATEYADFKAANDSLSTGRLAYIAEEKAGIFSLSASGDSSLENYRLAWWAEMADLEALDSLRQAGDTTTATLTQYAAAAQSAATAWAQYTQYAEGFTQAREQEIAGLLALNAAVTPELQPDENQQVVNGIVLNFLLSDSLANGNLDTLTAIAGQCPLEGGDAVYEARAIVAHYSDIEFDDYQICATAERQQKMQRGNAGSHISVYPNPTTGVVFFETTGEVQVRVFNQLGQLQLEKSLAGNRLDLGQLPPGLYRVQIFQDGRLMAAHSVVLINR